MYGLTTGVYNKMSISDIFRSTINYKIMCTIQLIHRPTKIAKHQLQVVARRNFNGKRCLYVCTSNAALARHSASVYARNQLYKILGIPSTKLNK